MLYDIHVLNYQIDSHYHDTALYYSVKQGDWGVTTLRCYMTFKLKAPLDFTGFNPKLAVKGVDGSIDVLNAVVYDYQAHTVDFKLTEKQTKYVGDITCQIFFEKRVEGQPGYQRFTMIPTWKIKVER